MGFSLLECRNIMPHAQINVIVLVCLQESERFKLTEFLKLTKPLNSVTKLRLPFFIHRSDQMYQV